MYAGADDHHDENENRGAGQYDTSYEQTVTFRVLQIPVRIGYLSFIGNLAERPFIQFHAKRIIAGALFVVMRKAIVWLQTVDAFDSKVGDQKISESFLVESIGTLPLWLRNFLVVRIRAVHVDQLKLGTERVGPSFFASSLGRFI